MQPAKGIEFFLVGVLLCKKGILTDVVNAWIFIPRNTLKKPSSDMEIWQNVSVTDRYTLMS